MANKRINAKQIENICIAAGLKITNQRKIIIQSLLESSDHPDAAMLFQRVSAKDKSVSMATVYRTLFMLERNKIVSKLDLGDDKSRYEICYGEENHHDHLIDIESGEIIEFQDKELEDLKEQIAKRLGYDLLHHSLELYCIKRKRHSE
ncbi:MAG: Fur family transcriptional regulator [Proteobacteria bacterium]|nr:Fur family transcriptional regulator [Pseudomonadota bacterium]